jgi:UDP-glucose-4-epimerase GalE/galactose-1-phosphate uridylyltransferase (family 1)
MSNNLATTPSGTQRMRVLVTGGAGYIGSVVAARLLEAGHAVTVLDDLSTGHADAVPAGAEFTHAPITDANSVLAAQHFDGVMHFAAKSLVGESVSAPERYWDTNVSGTLALLEAVRVNGVGRLVFSSTAAVYGEPSVVPITVDAATMPTNPYGSSKLAVDLMISSFAAAHGLAAVSLRYFNVAGAYGSYGERHATETHLIPIALQVAAGDREALEVFGTDYPTPDGSAVRDYIHVVDIADAHLLAFGAARPGEHLIYNLGTGVGTSVLEIADAIRQVTGHPLPTVNRGRRPGDPAVLIADGELARAELGWQPSRTLKDMVADAWGTTLSRMPRSPTRTVLSDGRELLYFDDEPGRRHTARDERDLATPVSTSEIRWDAIAREWTVVAGHRQDRTFKPSTVDCPLCPSRDGSQTEVPEDAYDVVVFENRFSSLSQSAADSVARGEELPFRSGPGVGRCEVIVFTDDHTSSFASLTRERAGTVIDAWVHRTLELRALPGVEYVYCFENRGDEIGVTLAHPHGQIYAYPFLPTRIARSAQTLLDHRDAGGGCLQCQLLADELDDGRRIVVTGRNWVGYVPFAARWPFELRLVPRRHIGSLPDLNGEERTELAEVYLDVLARFDRLFDTPAPYIAGWEQAPVGPVGAAWHLSANVFTIRRAPGKLKYLAGSESGAGVWINDIAPENAAARLRGEGQ